MSCVEKMYMGYHKISYLQLNLVVFSRIAGIEESIFSRFGAKFLTTSYAQLHQNIEI